jgi:lipid-A-disaccharide synthase
VKILISAAEASSDKQGAAVLRALQSEGEVQAFGMGGDHLIRAGLSAMVDAQDLMSMGFVEVVSRLPKINRALKILEEEAIRQKPDLALLIDYPDFHFQLAKRLKKLKIPIVNFIPPKTWAWRTGRVKDMKLLYDRVLCIFPFEEAFYESHGLSARSATTSAWTLRAS